MNPAGSCDRDRRAGEEICLLSGAAGRNLPLGRRCSEILLNRHLGCVRLNRIMEQSEIKTTDPCPSCGQPMEPVHFGPNPAGLVVYHGEPPDGILERLAEPFIGSRLSDESGISILARSRHRYQYPAMHCPRCRQIIVRYGS